MRVQCTWFHSTPNLLKSVWYLKDPRTSLGLKVDMTADRHIFAFLMNIFIKKGQQMTAEEKG